MEVLVPASQTPPRPFWRSTIGLTIRWALYVPGGILALKIIETLALFFLIWLYRDLRGFIMIGFLFGGFFFIFMAVAGFYLAVVCVAHVCPSPRPGMVVFGVFYGLLQLLTLAGTFFMSGPWYVATVHGISALITMGAALAAITQVWHARY